jgi:TatD DNase family protein
VTPRWVDSHCHLQEHYLPDDPDATALAALRRARDEGVVGVVVVGTDEATSRQAIELAQVVSSGALGPELPAVSAAVGLHPHEASSSLSWLDALVAEVPAHVAGLGECGLDYHYDHAPRAEQRASFSHQIALALEHDLTLVIHARDAWDDLFDILDADGIPPRCVLHCFTGGPAEAARCVERHLAVSFSGIATFKNAHDVRAAVREVPLEHLLIETDSPFLAPVPHRGAQNEPSWVGLVGGAVADAGGWGIEEVADVTARNAAGLFKLALGT